MSTQMHSAIYTGWIRHRRFKPTTHEFRYPIFMLYIDLDELEGVFNKKWFCSLERFNIVSFRREDYYAPSTGDLKLAVIKRVQHEMLQQSLIAPDIESVRMLSHARYFGFIFNPVTFYYCYDAKEKLVAVLTEITNTPWGERHDYVLPVGQSSDAVQYRLKGNKRHVYDFAKQFHVSPFNPMNMRYHWVFGEPSRELQVHMDNYFTGERSETGQMQLDSEGLDSVDNTKHFDATLVMSQRSIEREFGGILIRFPFMTVKVSVGIYWQALKLWMKKVPFYNHPKLDTQHSGKTFAAKESIK